MTPEQIAALAYQAGFRGSALTTAVAVALAESSGRPDVLGDLRLQTAMWGPSVGLWQIRSLNSESHTGGTRDRYADLNPLTNAKAAFAISSQGTSFEPWTTYNNGAYRLHMPAAEQGVHAYLATSGHAGVPTGPGGGRVPGRGDTPEPAARGTYVVQPGDNLTAIGESHGVSWQQIAAANPKITNPDLIYPGQILVIPAASASPGHLPAPPERPAPERSKPTKKQPDPGRIGGGILLHPRGGARKIFVDTQANRLLAADLRRHSHELAASRTTLLRAESHVNPPPASVGPVKQSIQGSLDHLAKLVETLQRQANDITANADALDREEGIRTGIPFLDRIINALFNPVAFAVAAGKIKWPALIWEVEHRVIPAAGPTAGGHAGPGSWLLHQGLNALAVPPYLAYFVGYNVNKDINAATDKLPGPLKDIAHVLTFPTRAAFAGLQGLGLGGDIVVDWIKGHTVNDESVADEGKRGYINPFHDWLPGPLKGPQVYLPGVHAGGGIDFSW